MAKYRKNRQARRIQPHARNLKSRSAPKPWGWLMAGMLMGILGITAIFLLITGKWPLKIFKPTTVAVSSESHDEKSPKPKSKPKSTKLAQKKEPARFEFYQLLPGMEVPLPEPKTDTVACKPSPLLTNMTPEPASKPLITSEKKVEPIVETKIAAAQYLIQAGRFRVLNNAEFLKKRLNTQGLSSQIQKIEAEDGTWFRVTLGPFSSETMALNQKSRLAKEKIPGLLILQRQ